MAGKESSIGVVSLFAGIVLGGFGYRALFSKNPTVDTADAATKDSGGAAAADLRAENERLRAKISALLAEGNRHGVAEAEKAAARAPSSAEELAAAAAKAGVVFDDPEFQEALASIDWNAVGMSMKDMVPLLAQLAEKLATGEMPDLAAVGEVQKLNGELMKAAQKIMEGKIPGSGVNGAFTHPAVVANQFAAALAAAGLKLSDDQRASMEQIMKFYSAKDESLRLADHESKIQTLIEEAAFKDAFYKETRGLLSPEQKAAISIEGYEGRLGLDIFDSTLMLAQYAQPLPVANAAELSASVSSRIAGAIKLDDAERKQLTAIVDRWSKQLDAGFWSAKANRLDMRGNMSGDRMRAALRRQAALTKEILANVQLSPQARAKLLENMRFFVPLPR